MRVKRCRNLNHLASTKGGVGKPTVAFCLTTALARHLHLGRAGTSGFRVTRIDADPNRTLQQALRIADMPDVRCVESGGETLLPAVRDAQAAAGVVIIDLEGSAIGSDNSEDRDSGIPDIQHAGTLGGGKDAPNTPQPSAPAVVAAPRPTRGPRRGVEFLLPEQVVIALKTEAAQRGMSMTVRMLEILGDAGYLVRDQDFIASRKLPRK